MLPPVVLGYQMSSRDLLSGFLTPDSQVVLAATNTYSVEQLVNHTKSYLSEPKAEIKLKMSHHLSAVNYSKLQTKLSDQVRQLGNEAYWDGPALAVYIKDVQKNATNDNWQTYLESLHQDTYLVGSPIYTRMYLASRLKPSKKAMLPIRQMGGYIDKNRMLQLNNPKFMFYGKMDPNGVFLGEFANTVKAIYQRPDSTYTPMGKDDYQRDLMIHNFRYWIDYHDILYIRHYFPGQNDFEKMVAYQRREGMTLYWGESSRMHNKFAHDRTYGGQINDKLLSHDKNGEFIINMKTKKFNTEWDVLKVSRTHGYHVVSDPAFLNTLTHRQKREIVDAESFNYASPLDFGGHYALDIAPATPPSPNVFKPSSEYLENDIKRKLKDMLMTPDAMIYHEHYNGTLMDKLDTVNDPANFSRRLNRIDHIHLFSLGTHQHPLPHAKPHAAKRAK